MDALIEGFAAGRLDIGILEAEHRGHRAAAERRRLLHHAAAKLHELDGGAEVERAGRDEGRELPEAVA